LFGVAPETIDGLIHDLATAPVDNRLRPIFAFVKKLTLTPTRMTQADAAPSTRRRWQDTSGDPQP
jgi:hypothetical protein